MSHLSSRGESLKLADAPAPNKKKVFLRVTWREEEEENMYTMCERKGVNTHILRHVRRSENMKHASFFLPPLSFSLSLSHLVCERTGQELRKVGEREKRSIKEKHHTRPPSHRHNLFHTTTHTHTYTYGQNNVPFFSSNTSNLFVRK